MNLVKALPSGVGFMWRTLDLYLPPSVNRFRARLGNRSPAVQIWIRQCDALLMTQKPLPRIAGAFEIEITWAHAELGASDIDNRIKPLLDYLQALEVIQNDRLCREMHVGFGRTKEGCRVSLREWSE